jgi:hypothetical protein
VPMRRAASGKTAAVAGAVGAAAAAGEPVPALPVEEVCCCSASLIVSLGCILLCCRRLMRSWCRLPYISAPLFGPFPRYSLCVCSRCSPYFCLAYSRARR